MQLRVRESEKWKRAAGFEMNSQKLIGSAPFDEERFRAWGPVIPESDVLGLFNLMTSSTEPIGSMRSRT